MEAWFFLYSITPIIVAYRVNVPITVSPKETKNLNYWTFERV